MIILLINIQLNSIHLLFPTRWNLPWPCGRQGSQWMCGFVCAEQDMSVGLPCCIPLKNGDSFLWIIWSGISWLSRKYVLVLFADWSVWFSFPSSCMWLLRLWTDRQSYQKQTHQLFTLSVLLRRDCLKGKTEFWKDFQTFGILSFENSGGNDVEGQGVYFWRLGFLECLDFLGEREGDLQGATRGQK